MIVRYDPKALRRCRRKQAIGQGELAHRARLSLRGLGYLEHGLHEPRAGTLARLASALGVSIDAFFRQGKSRRAA